MKLIYIHNTEITSNKANLVQVVSMCNAFSNLGIRVELVLPLSSNQPDNPNEYLANKIGLADGVKLAFYKKITVLNRLSMLGSYFGVKKFLKQSKGDIYFTRCPLIFTQVAQEGHQVIFESHNTMVHEKIKLFNKYWTKKVLQASLQQNCKVFISISSNLSNYWINRGVPHEKSLALHDGFDMQLFQKEYSKEDARKILNIDAEKKLVVYAGSLYPDREIDNIIKLAIHLNNVQFMVVGGPTENAKQYKQKAEANNANNILFTGPVAHKTVPLYLFAADVLLALWSERVPTINYCSPLKVFEYMAAGRVIVADGFPTIKEVIYDKVNGLLVIPGSFSDLIKQTQKALIYSESNKIGSQVRAEAFEHYSWTKRTQMVLNMLDQHLQPNLDTKNLNKPTSKV